MAECWCVWRPFILDIMDFVYTFFFLFILQDHIENHFLYPLGVQAIKTPNENPQILPKKRAMPKTYRQYNKEATFT